MTTRKSEIPAIIETNRIMSEALLFVELINVQKTIPSKTTSRTKLPIGPNTGPWMPEAWNMNWPKSEMS
tara:strand:+ start:100 stop:306 length:207 start_codon:yes stop_codon:yes gene_type:complete